ncbi:MAG: FAD-dependent oxidoreductase [Christensenellaceae bacterium]|nr:FAD-dependent oxidoreductase [Christensenellaceae bacterium]
MIRKFFSALLVLTLSLSLCVISIAEDYTATAKGYGGDVVVTLTMEGDKIIDVAIVGDGETPSIGGAAFSALKEQLLIAQSAEIDGVTGATITSTAVKAAVQKALDEANGVVRTTEIQYKPGTYTGTGKGMLGPINVEVEVSETEIINIKVTSCVDTLKIGTDLSTAPVNQIPADIIEYQSLNVDSVTGATVTSVGVLAAVTDALEQSGVNISLLQDKAVEKAVQENETLTCDVVIAGAGGAGLSAAFEAASNGANVIVVEKAGVLTGESNRNGGLLMASGTSYVDLSNDELYEYIVNTIGQGKVNADKVRAYVDNSNNLLTFFESIGTAIDAVQYISYGVVDLPVVFMANNENANGEVDILTYFDHTSGSYYISPLYNKAVEAGTEVLFNTPMTAINQDTTGKVSGITCTRADGSVVTINAKAVIIATGGYAGNEELINQNVTLKDSGYYLASSSTNKGDGIWIARDLGAKIRFEKDMPANAPLANSATGNLTQSLCVTPKGERFTREFDYFFSVVTDLNLMGYGNFYQIIDASFNDDFFGPAIASCDAETARDIFSADSVKELAEKIGVDPATLEETISRYNELCLKGVDEDFDKNPAYMKEITVDGSKKLYALKHSPTLCGTYGGIYTDLQQRVLNTEEKPIDGLYAAGSCALADTIYYEYPGCGYAFGLAIHTGHIAAINALRDLGFENVQSVISK